MAKENSFQSGLIKELKTMFPGCYVLKNDANYIQGFPDLTILTEHGWAVLECKASKDADHQPNQDYYVQDLNRKSYSAFIYPENKEQILHELQQAFTAGGTARIPERK